MTEKQAGLTAMSMAYARAYHAIHDSPKVFDDFLAASLFTPEELSQWCQNLASMLPYIDAELAAKNPGLASALALVVRLTNGPITLGRSHYAEECLEKALRNGVCQYVILGAGFDTFAYRRPDLEDRLQVFELDHPATQAIKRERVANAGWGERLNLHYVPVDFSKEGLKAALEHTSYDRHQPSFFSWLGVSYYLTREQVFETLGEIASITAKGSEVVFDHLDTDAFLPEKAGALIQQMIFMAAQLGEPIKAGFDPLELGAELELLDLHLEETLDPAAIEVRIFQGSSGYHAVQHFHYARARVS